ncbi:hypothetical protein [Brevibacillus laterosporus]|uniref:hypothetical protein n=1 Tax=Brevibacillus laterosporus TaxID=1465 RepID=UPI000CE545EA|nr:hypothetical protein [Brevibacillus laterosporus]AYB40519.1 hypothetical protein D5F52_21055 [Brevibacillus laterosporus]MBG9773358.1 hypothetical protein [Brevibacillus laterosporus]NKQ22833.1 hypothetical protein [Brevibacillus laterosporus]WNX31267.1 hypothetical protein RWW94_24415 [Brevibacillus laterosporus]
MKKVLKSIVAFSCLASLLIIPTVSFASEEKTRSGLEISENSIRLSTHEVTEEELEKAEEAKARVGEVVKNKITQIANESEALLEEVATPFWQMDYHLDFEMYKKNVATEKFTLESGYNSIYVYTDVETPDTDLPHFTMELYRVSGISESYIGAVKMKLNGSDSDQFLNIGPGKYYFLLSKGHDGTTAEGVIKIIARK